MVNEKVTEVGNDIHRAALLSLKYASECGWINSTPIPTGYGGSTNN